MAHVQWYYPDTCQNTILLPWYMAKTHNITVVHVQNTIELPWYYMYRKVYV